MDTNKEVAQIQLFNGNIYVILSPFNVKYFITSEMMKK